MPEAPRIPRPAADPDTISPALPAGSSRALSPARVLAAAKAAVLALRIAAGVMALIESVVGILMAGMLLFVRHGGASTAFNGWMNFFLIAGSIGCLVTGIVILTKQRKRGGATPWLVTSFAGLAMLGCLGLMTGDPGLPGAPLLTLPFALATLVLAILVLVKDKAQAPIQRS